MRVLLFTSHQTDFRATLQASSGEGMKLPTLLLGITVVTVTVLDAACAGTGDRFRAEASEN
jgi:hypothetical protein